MEGHVTISKIYEFDSAHFLPNYDGKCRKLHGHRFKMEVTISGKINENENNPEYGMIIDFNKLDGLFERLQLDHCLLNGLVVYPTAEYLVAWIAESLSALVPWGTEVEEVKLWETPKSCATWKRAERKEKDEE